VRGFRRLVWVETKLFLRDPFGVVFVFAFPLVVLLVLAGIFAEDDSDDFRGANGVDYYLAGYVAVVIAAVGLIGLPVHLAAYRERGVLRRFRASGIPIWSFFGAQVVIYTAMAAVGSLWLALVATLFYDVRRPESLAGVVVAFAIGALGFVALGFLLAALLPSARAAQAAGLTLFFPMWLLAGSGPPRQILDDWMQDVGDVLPLTHVITAIQDPWLGFGWNGGELAVLTGLLVVAAALSARLFRWE
jgi:ABC-2 type transport system permease protein